MAAQTSNAPAVTVISQQAPSIVEFLRPRRAVLDLWQQRTLIIELSRAELVSRYKGSVLGVLWAVINPLLLLTIYTLVFSGILHARWSGINNDDPVAFGLILFVGLLVFSFVSETLNRCCNSVTSVPNYVKKIVFPLQVIPVTVVMTALTNLVIGFVILLIADFALTGHAYISFLLLPVTLAPAILLALAAGWMLASIGVFVRDVSLAIGFVVQVMFFVTPIFYPIDAVPDPWRAIVLVNPLATVIEDARAVVLWGEFPPLAPLVGLIGLSAGLALIAYAWFMKTKRGFADAL